MAIICYDDATHHDDDPISDDGGQDYDYPTSDDDDGGYNYDDTTSDSSSFSSPGVVVGTTIGGLSICGIVVLLVVCRFYVRYSLTRQRNNATYGHTQSGTLVARVTRTTTDPSGPPPPPPYTPSSDYTPVPPRGYQPVHTDDYTTTPTAPSSDVPSEPPPEYTTSVSTALITPDTV